MYMCILFVLFSTLNRRRVGALEISIIIIIISVEPKVGRNFAMHVSLPALYSAFPLYSASFFHSLPLHVLIFLSLSTNRLQI